MTRILAKCSFENVGGSSDVELVALVKPSSIKGKSGESEKSSITIISLRSAGAVKSNKYLR
jgi:hypothetical protein